jgi:rRNA maturation RNase YbeY
MINFNYEIPFELDNTPRYEAWINVICSSEGKTVGEINYIFCNNDYLHKINLEFLQHDTLTDVITFDYSIGNELTCDIYISVEMINSNAIEYQTIFVDELHRVMCHGLLHCCGFNDKFENDVVAMREKENEKMLMFHVERI